ncbi:MAG: L,D-transpeptidase [Chloroflexota bacterium]
MSPVKFSRRDFLKLSGAALLGLLLPDVDLSRVSAYIPPNQQGRILTDTLTLYKEPTDQSEKASSFWRDVVLPLNGVEVDDDGESHNRVWYRMGDYGFAYSGDVQPVRTELQQPQEAVPARGALADVTVPYTDARQEPKEDSKVAFRLYYDTTHWVAGAASDEAGQAWYRIFDDRFNTHYYAQAKHLRLVPEDELLPISPDVPSYQKAIEVRLSQQLVTAYEGSRMVFATRASSGVRFRRGGYATPFGNYKTNYKRPSRHMAAGDIASNGYDLPGVPWVLYITKSGISFHGTFWHNDFGTPHSHGCINLSPQAARWLYRWTLPTVPHDAPLAYKDYGTSVTIVD